MLQWAHNMPMSKSFALVVAFVATTSGAAFAQAIFDSPGRGYREQRDRPKQIRVPTDLAPLGTIPATDVSFHISMPAKDAAAALKLEAVAQYAAADEGAAAKIRRAFTEAGIPFIITESVASVVNVDPSRAKEAKTLLQNVAAEGHWSVLVTAAEASNGLR
jgi:hypothetical protein